MKKCIPQNLAANYRTGLLMSFLAAVLIGIMPTAAKLSYQEGANPITLLVVRSIIGAVSMSVFLRLRGETLAIPSSYVGPTALSGVALFLAAGGAMSSVAFIDVSLASVLFFTYPFFVAAVNHVRGQARISKIEMVLIGTAFSGLALALGVGFQNLNSLGVALALSASLGTAIMVLTTTSTSVALGTIRTNLHMTLWTCGYFILLAGVGPKFGVIQVAEIPDTVLGWIYVFLAGFSFAFGYLCFFVAARIFGSTRASLLSILEPIMMIFFAFLLVGEWLNPQQWLGIAAVIGSLLLTELIALRRHANSMEA